MTCCKISDLKKIFGSNAKSQEIMLLLSGVKNVVRQGFYDHEYEGVERFCRENGLFLVRSRFKVIVSDSNMGYSNKGVRVSEDDPREGMFFAYMSKDELDAYDAAYHEQVGDHEKLGNLLGYPRCCVDYFISAFSERNTNPQMPSDNPFTDISRRGEDIVLISHFPCSPSCRKSIELGKRYLKVIEENDPQHAQNIRIRLGI